MARNFLKGLTFIEIAALICAICGRAEGHPDFSRMHKMNWQVQKIQVARLSVSFYPPSR
jgi:hypothetical protein